MDYFRNRKKEKELNKRISEHNKKLEENPAYAKAFNLYKQLISDQDKNPEEQCRATGSYLPQPITREQALSQSGLSEDLDISDTLAVAYLAKGAFVSVNPLSTKSYQSKRDRARWSVENGLQQSLDEQHARMNDEGYELYNRYSEDEIASIHNVIANPKLSTALVFLNYLYNGTGEDLERITNALNEFNYGVNIEQAEQLVAKYFADLTGHNVDHSAPTKGQDSSR